MIPKIIHQIWLGDQTKRPSTLMNTWKDLNPSWEHKVWTEENIPEIINKKHFDNCENKYTGKANILRYELLYMFGGFYIDADSKAITPLDDFLLNNNSFACWENEKAFPNRISNGYLASERGNIYIKRLIDEIYEMDDILVKNIAPWRVTGVTLLTNLWHSGNDMKNDMKIYPSHYFIPQHFTGIKYEGNDKVYCEQYWGNTLQIYDKLKG